MTKIIPGYESAAENCRQVEYESPVKMPKRLNKVQRKLMIEIIDEVNRDNIDVAKDMLADQPTWFWYWPLWSAGENMPGYMPDSPYCLFLTERAAKGYCRELESDHDNRYVTDYMPTTLRESLY